MRKYKTVLDAIKMSVPEKIAFCENVSVSMKAEAETFKTPDKSLTEFDADVTNLRTSSQASLNGGRAEKAFMYQMEALVDEDLRVLSRYVDRIANGDDVIILSSGFHLAKQPIPAQKAIMEAENAKIPGTVNVKRQAVDGSKSYLWQHSVDGKEWTFAGASTSSRYTINDLIPVTRYFFRAASVTVEGTSAFTEPVSLVVQ